MRITVAALTGVAFTEPHLGREVEQAGAPAAGDRIAVGAGGGIAEDRCKPLLQQGRYGVLQALGLLVRLTPIQAEHVGEEALHQAMPAHEPLGERMSLLGQPDFLALGQADQALLLQAAEGAQYRRRRDPDDLGDPRGDGGGDPPRSAGRSPPNTVRPCP